MNMWPVGSGFSLSTRVSRSLHTACVSAAFLLWLIVSRCVAISHCVCPSSVGGRGLFPPLAVVNCAAVKMGVHVFESLFFFLWSLSPLFE